MKTVTRQSSEINKQFKNISSSVSHSIFHNAYSILYTARVTNIVTKSLFTNEICHAYKQGTIVSDMFIQW